VKKLDTKKYKCANISYKLLLHSALTSEVQKLIFELHIQL